jgi:hypothetical protein
MIFHYQKHTVLNYLRGISPNFYIHVTVSGSSIPRIGPHIFLQHGIGRAIVEIYKSLTDT